MKTGDTYVIPAGTTLRLIELQQSFVTTKKYGDDRQGGKEN